MTATVSLAGSRRENAVRIPNSALSFRPTPTMLRGLGQPENIESDLEIRRVWHLNAGRLEPVVVKTGLANAEWTEQLDGPLKAGDSLVTGISQGTADGNRR